MSVAYNYYTYSDFQSLIGNKGWHIYICNNANCAVTGAAYDRGGLFNPLCKNCGGLLASSGATQGGLQSFNSLIQTKISKRASNGLSTNPW